MSSYCTDIVPAKRKLRIGVRSNNVPQDGYVLIDLSRRTNYRGSDFEVYANTGYLGNSGDSDFLEHILFTLLGDSSSGVERVKVTPYSLGLLVSPVASRENLMELIDYAAQRAGYETEIVTTR